MVPGLRFEPEVPRGLGGVIASLVVGGIVGFVRLHGRSSSPPGGPSFSEPPWVRIVGLLGVGFSYVTHTLQTSSTAARVFRPVLAAVLPLAVLAPVAYVLALAIQA